jgi:HAD superfamily hydrolase (TIGR01490 family)
MPTAAAPVAVFDFDGTITRRDSTAAFCRAEFGSRLPLAILRAAPWLAGYPVGRVGRQRLKEALLTPLLGGRPETEVRARAADWAARRLPGMVRPAALERLRWHQAQGHRVVLASASLELLLEPWARSAGVHDVLATRLEVRDGRLTGRIAGRNCYGPEKVARLRALLGDLRGFELYAYGDSEGDRQLLAAAQHPVYRPFHDEGG